MAKGRKIIGLRNAKADTNGKTLMAIGGILLYCGILKIVSAREWYTVDEFVDTVSKAANTDSTK